jgi:hypothetical protein
MFVTFEKTGDYGIRKESIHPLKKSGVKNIGFIHDEADFFAFAAWAA